ncbi:hypothetical protein J6590_048150, partial [Homalodisca vitripennis]
PTKMLVILEKAANTSASLTGENEKRPLAASRKAALSSATYSRAVHSCIEERNSKQHMMPLVDPTVPVKIQTPYIGDGAGTVRPRRSVVGADMCGLAG